MPNNTPIVIKKYPNRRLYNTETSKYITLQDLSNLIKQDKNFKVIDIKTNEDITRVTLAQIILDHETKGYEMLHIDVLKLIIKLYDHPLNQAFSSFILGSLAQWQRSMEQFKSPPGNADMPFLPQNWQKSMDQFTTQNQKFFDDMLSAFNRKK